MLAWVLNLGFAGTSGISGTISRVVELTATFDAGNTMTATFDPGNTMTATFDPGITVTGKGDEV